MLSELNLIKANPGISISRLAKETNTSERTVYRDIHTLTSSLVPIYYKDGYHLPETAFLPILNFTAEEYFQLRLGLDCCALRRDDLQEKSRSLLAKINAVVDAKTRSVENSLAASCRIFCKQTNQLKRVSSFAQILQKAINDSRRIKLTLENTKNGITERVVHPYSLVFRSHSWYLLGFCEHDSTFCLFNLNLLQRITLLDERFKRDFEFKVEQFFENKWEISGGKLYNVQIMFKGTAAKQILSHQHHPKEKVLKRMDGSVLYSITIEGLEEIANWVITFGNEAEVFKPKELRERLFRMGKEFSELYG